jgi:hypothetical protein
MENEVNQASGTVSGMQHITRTGCLGTGQSAENERQFPVVIGEASGAIPHTATTRPCRGSAQQETHPVETVSQAKLRTTKTGKPRQHIQCSDEMNTFIMRQYYIITKLETIKIEYRRELQDRFMRQYPEMDISEQRIADQRRAIITEGLISKPWLDDIKAQVAETFKETNVNTEEGATQPTDETEHKEESCSLEKPQTVENPQLDKIRTEFYKALKEIEATDPSTRYQIPKQSAPES